MENMTSTETPMTNTSNITTADNSTTVDNSTTFENQTNKTNPDESSGMTPEVTPMTNEPMTKEPTKKPTEKRSTDIIDILIGSRRRRASRVRRYFDLIIIKKNSCSLVS